MVADNGKLTKQQQQAEKRAAALRENLRRRKEAANARQSAPTPDEQTEQNKQD